MPDCALHALSRSKIALLTTYKRDGTAVSTPVSVVVDRDGDVAYIRTYSHTGKAKRLRRNPAVLAARRRSGESPLARPSVVWPSSCTGTPQPGHRARYPGTRRC